MSDPTITLALGGGGIGGIGHIPVLQALDDLGLRPTALSGVSAGAIVGACYASGMSGDDLYTHARNLAANQAKLLFNAFRPRTLTGGRTAMHVIDSLFPDTMPDRFDELRLPLIVGATDIDAREAVYFSDGDLRTIVAASMAIPTLFDPVDYDGRRLVDGGILNNIALAPLPPSDIVIAVDAASQPKDMTSPKSGLSMGVHAMQVMMEAMTAQTIATHKPDVVIRTRKSPITLSEVLNADGLLSELDALREETKRAVSDALDRHSAP